MSDVVDRFGCHGFRSFVSLDQFCRSVRAKASTRLLAGIGVIIGCCQPASCARMLRSLNVSHAPFRVLRSTVKRQIGRCSAPYELPARFEQSVDEQATVLFQ